MPLDNSRDLGGPVARGTKKRPDPLTYDRNDPRQLPLPLDEPSDPNHGTDVD
jgi:hypothetical protein